MTICRIGTEPVMKALGADKVIIINEIDIEKELELHDKYVKLNMIYLYIYI